MSNVQKYFKMDPIPILHQKKVILSINSKAANSVGCPCLKPY